MQKIKKSVPNAKTKATLPQSVKHPSIKNPGYLRRGRHPESRFGLRLRLLDIIQRIDSSSMRALKMVSRKLEGIISNVVAWGGRDKGVSGLHNITDLACRFVIVQIPRSAVDGAISDAQLARVLPGLEMQSVLQWREPFPMLTQLACDLLGCECRLYQLRRENRISFIVSRSLSRPHSLSEYQMKELAVNFLFKHRDASYKLLQQRGPSYPIGSGSRVHASDQIAFWLQVLVDIVACSVIASSTGQVTDLRTGDGSLLDAAEPTVTQCPWPTVSEISQ